MLHFNIPFAEFTKGKIPSIAKIFRSIALALLVASFASLFASSLAVPQDTAPAAATQN